MSNHVKLFLVFYLAITSSYSWAADLDNYFSKANQYMSIGESKKADKYCRKALKKEPTSTRAKRCLGFTSVDLLKFNEASTYLEQVETNYPDDVRVFFWLYKSNQIIGKPVKAQKYSEILETRFPGKLDEMEAKLTQLYKKQRIAAQQQKQYKQMQRQQMLINFGQALQQNAAMQHQQEMQRQQHAHERMLQLNQQRQYPTNTTCHRWGNMINCNSY